LIYDSDEETAFRRPQKPLYDSDEDATFKRPQKSVYETDQDIDINTLTISKQNNTNGDFSPKRREKIVYQSNQENNNNFRRKRQIRNHYSYDENDPIEETVYSSEQYR